MDDRLPQVMPALSPDVAASLVPSATAIVHSLDVPAGMTWAQIAEGFEEEAPEDLRQVGVDATAVGAMIRALIVGGVLD